jgi:2,3-bisphosphoglycerate-dependent phosphoglycerate mutase
MSQVLYLVRHCQATGQEPDAPLTETGRKQAIELASWFSEVPIERIISSPFARAFQSVMPLSKHLGVKVEVDQRLIERVLSPVQLDNWRECLAKTFVDLDLNFEGGESSYIAMMRGVAVVSQTIQQTANPVVIVTHGNLMTLILKYFNEQVGYAEWENLQNPDIYSLKFSCEEIYVERITQASMLGR